MIPLRFRPAVPAMSAVAFALAAAIAAVPPLSAHEGEVHPEPPAPTTVAAAGSAAYVAESGMHELLFRSGTIEPAHRTSVHLLLTDWATNAPVEGARLALSSPALPDSGWDAHAEGPGIYVATVTFPKEGTFPVHVVVRHGEELDLLTLDSVRVGAMPASPGVAGASGTGLPPWAFAAFAGFGVLAIASLAYIARLRIARRGAGGRALGLVAACAIAALLARGALAHEGEVHGEDEAPPARNLHALHGAGAAAVPPGARFMAKEAQFDLGLRTVVAHVDSVGETRRAFGTVVADPAAAADIVAPQTGRFVGRRAWRIGDRIGRGQALGAVLVVDELPVRSPISGTITALTAVPGQTVAAGQAIARVSDLDRVRVEVALYGEALAAGTRARSAVVRLPALPGRPLDARVEGLAAASDGGPSVPLVLAVRGGGDILRPGMVVEAELRLPGARPGILVPADAVLSTERGRVVFVKVGPEAFVLRPVTAGPAAGGHVALYGGVEEGERVVVSAAGALLSTPEVPR